MLSAVRGAHLSLHRRVIIAEPTPAVVKASIYEMLPRLDYR